VASIDTLKGAQNVGQFKKVRWHSITIDEGHIIKNVETKRYKAVASLGPSAFRIMLTGTIF
jgi:SNF2 family DNA or RNA helicase